MTATAEDITGTPSRAVDYGNFTFRVQKWVLEDLAGHASAVVPSSGGAVPVLSCFQVRVSEAGLRLSATNTVLSIVAESLAVAGAPAQEGLAYIPARKLLAILKETPDGDFTIAVKKNIATITAGSYHADQRLPDGSHFPDLPDLSLVSFSSAPKAPLLSGLKTVRHTVGRDTSSPPQMQVSLAPHEPGGMFATSIAGSRCTRAPVGGFPEPMNIPAAGLHHLIRLLASHPGDEVEVGRANSVLVFRAGPVTFMVNPSQAPFPNVDGQLLAKARETNKDTLSIDRESLAQTIRRVRINANPDTSAIALQLHQGAVIVEARAGQDTATEPVKAAWSGPDRVLTVNHVHLLEMLDAHPSQTCVFKIGPDKGKSRSAVLLEDAESGVTGVLAQMPPGVVGY